MNGRPAPPALRAVRAPPWVLRTPRRCQNAEDRHAALTARVGREPVAIGAPHDEQEQTRGRPIIPDTAKEKPQEGEVIAIGNGKILEDSTRRPAAKMISAGTGESAASLSHATI